jgi:hypothetical protein
MGTTNQSNRVLQFVTSNLLGLCLRSQIAISKTLPAHSKSVARSAGSCHEPLSLLAQGENEETILADYPDLEADDLRACLAYAHAAISHDKLDSLHLPA